MVRQRAQRPFIRNAPFHAFRHGLAALPGILHRRVAIRARFHRARRTHPAVRLERAPLIQNCFARRLFRSGEQASNHHTRRACGQRFRDVSRIFDAPVSDQRHFGALRRTRRFHDGRQLRHSRAGHHAGGADRTRPDADFQSIHAQRNQFFRAFVGRHVSGDDLRFRQALANRLDRFHHAKRMPVRRVNRQHIHFGLGQFHGPLQKISRRAHRRAHAQSSVLILRRARIFQFFLDVFYRDQSLQVEVLIHNQQFFDAMLLQNAFRFVQRCADGHGHEIFLGHHRADELRMIFLETQIAVGQNSRQARSACHRKPGNFVLVHDFQRLPDGDVRRNGDRVDDHSAFRALHAVHFFSLFFRGHAAMHDADAALPRDGNGQPRLRYGVHGRGGQRHIQLHLARKIRGRIHFRRQHRRPARNQQHVVKSKSVGNRTFVHSNLTSTNWLRK